MMMRAIPVRRNIRQVALPNVRFLYLCLILGFRVCEGLMNRYFPRKSFSASRLHRRGQEIFNGKSGDKGLYGTNFPEENETYIFVKRGHLALPKDLISPEMNLNDQTLLFSDTANVCENNNALKLWNVVVNYLPTIVTGDSKTFKDGASNPLELIYNMLFVRIPTILAGIVYGKNLFEGHPLVVDIGFVGNGPIEVSPILVFIVLASILR